MADLKATQVTKFDAGGSGDNYIADGYIKTVEKVWLDSYTNTTNVIGSDDSIKIAVIPKNKKITSVTVQLPALGDAGSVASIFIGSASTFLMTTDNCYLGALEPMAEGNNGVETVDTASASTLVLKSGAMGTVTDKEVSLWMKIVTDDGLDLTLTNATINSIVRYT